MLRTRKRDAKLLLAIITLDLVRNWVAKFLYPLDDDGYWFFYFLEESILILLISILTHLVLKKRNVCIAWATESWVVINTDDVVDTFLNLDNNVYILDVFALGYIIYKGVKVLRSL